MSHTNTLRTIEDLIGKPKAKTPKPLEAAATEVEKAELDLSTARQARANAEKDLKLAPREELAADVAAIRTLDDGDDPLGLDLGPSPVEVANSRLEDRSRRVRAADARHKAAVRDFEAEVAAQQRWYEGNWAEYVSNPDLVTHETSMGEAGFIQARAKELASLIGSVAVAIGRYHGATPQEIKDLKTLVKEKPEAFPTLAAVRAARRTANESTPHAQARRRAAQEREAKKIEAHRTSRLAALARRGELKNDDSES